MLELATRMTDSQVEQIEETDYLGQGEVVKISPPIAHAFGWVLEQMCGQPLREIGVILENSKAGQIETNQNLLDLLADLKSSHATLRNTVNGLAHSKKAQIRVTSTGQMRFEFSGVTSAEPLESKTITISGKILDLLIDTFQQSTVEDLTVLAGNSETIASFSTIKAVQVDSRVVNRRAQKLVEVFQSLKNLSEIKVIGYKIFELVVDKEKALIG